MSLIYGFRFFHDAWHRKYRLRSSERPQIHFPFSKPGSTNSRSMRAIPKSPGARSVSNLDKNIYDRCPGQTYRPQRRTEYSRAIALRDAWHEFVNVLSAQHVDIVGQRVEGSYRLRLRALKLLICCGLDHVITHFRSRGFAVQGEMQRRNSSFLRTALVGGRLWC